MIYRPLLAAAAVATCLAPTRFAAPKTYTLDGTHNRSDFGLETALGPVDDTVSIHIEALAIAED